MNQIFLTIAVFSILAILPFAIFAQTTANKCVSGDCVNGRGKMVYSNGNIYEGDFVNGKAEGHGTSNFADRATYTGQYSKDLFHGKGKYNYPDGSVYDGNWVNGKIEGRGKYFNSNGTTSEGDYVNGKAHGKGKLVNSKGDIYEGDWVNGLAEGQGIFKLKDGRIYTGQFYKDNFHGKGKIIYADGDIYEGDWLNGARDGQGTYTAKNGSYYIGAWKNDKQNGYGKDYNKSTDTTREGTYKDGFLSVANAQQSKTAEEWYNLGNASKDTKDYEKAIAHYSKAIEIKPKYASAYLGRSGAYSGLKKYPEVLADCSKARELNTDPSATASADLCIGFTRVELEKSGDAIKSYSECIRLNPNASSCYIGRGEANQKLKKHSEAIADFNKTIELDNKFDTAYFNRGKSYFLLDKNNEAIADFNKALELNPKLGEAYYERGEAYFYSDKLPEAIEDYTKAIEIDENIEAYLGRGEAYRKNGKFSQAVDDYTVVIDNFEETDDDGYTAALFGRGKAKTSLKRYEGAIVDFSEVIKIEPKHRYCSTARGLVYFQVMRYKEAKADLERALLINPDDKLAKEYLAKIAALKK
jgi:tetratricopeptide (TPR) repeat protein